MNYYITSRLGAVTLLIVSTCGLLISIDTLIHMSGWIPTIIYTSSLLALLGATYLLVKENK
jgi:uncharacterized membrane protein YdcZ (DUF606 family)|tara:strand:- start:573 stop:755 length:183 start_codon:yes stop_codon:yes gene_type:complete